LGWLTWGSVLVVVRGAVVVVVARAVLGAALELGGSAWAPEAVSEWATTAKAPTPAATTTTTATEVTIARRRQLPRRWARRAARSCSSEVVFARVPSVLTGDEWYWREPGV
jgi:hypothetical protein